MTRLIGLGCVALLAGCIGVRQSLPAATRDHPGDGRCCAPALADGRGIRHAGYDRAACKGGHPRLDADRRPFADRHSDAAACGDRAVISHRDTDP